MRDYMKLTHCGAHIAADVDQVLRTGKSLYKLCQYGGNRARAVQLTKPRHTTLAVLR